MDISLYLINYIQSRIDYSTNTLELYIADTIQSSTIEIIIKDDGKKINDEKVNSKTFAGLLELSRSLGGQISHLYHRKQTTVQFEFQITEKSKVNINDFHSLFGVMMLNNPSVNIVFSYLSKKGEYTLNSLEIIQAFEPSELLQKEILIYMNELLSDHLNQIRDAL